MRKIFSLVMLMMTGSAVYADIGDYLPEAKLKSAAVSRWNAGAGMTMKLAHLNAEWVNAYGIAYAKAGAFINGDHEPGVQFGFRYPVVLNGTDSNGFYLGFYAGHLKSKSVGNGDDTQAGGGVDLSYVLLNKERISTFSVGIGVGDESSHGNSIVFESKPQIQFAYTLSVGF
ncbi:hypothetical protein [Acinetobacter sp. WZC-1]|uniref:hypothetical protein n=1 Tax=Acinetobacter sp. WZC-1 TaxID=3459034 RepID=UPI00403E0C16